MHLSNQSPQCTRRFFLPPVACVHTSSFGVFFFCVEFFAHIQCGSCDHFFTVYSWFDLYLCPHSHSLIRHFFRLFHYHSAFPSVSGDCEVWLLFGSGFLQLFHDGSFTSLFSLSVSTVSFWVVGFFVRCAWRYQFVFFFVLCAYTQQQPMESILRLRILFFACHDGLLWREEGVGFLYVFT